MSQTLAKQLLANFDVIKACAEGKTIQYKIGGGWVDARTTTFGDSSDRYRIKPEPRAWYMVVRADGTVLTAHLDRIHAQNYTNHLNASPGAHGCTYALVEVEEKLS